jgi:hypothetical protein
MAHIPVDCRINIPLSPLLDFARNEPQSRSEQVALGLRPLLALALATAGHVDATARGQAPALPRSRESSGASGDSEILFSALSTLVEVVKSLTPDAGKLYAHLGHQAIPSADDDDGDEDRDALDGAVGDDGDDGDDRHASKDAAAIHPGQPTAGAAYPARRNATIVDTFHPGHELADAPRSEVVIELVSTGESAHSELPALLLDGSGAVAFELAVVAAIVESKGGQLSLGSPGGQSRSFTVRLPVYR